MSKIEFPPIPPCLNCICVPVCRHKRFGHLAKCGLLEQYFGKDLTAKGGRIRSGYWGKKFMVKMYLRPVWPALGWGLSEKDPTVKRLVIKYGFFPHLIGVPKES
jgi:hypothetical protein